MGTILSFCRSLKTIQFFLMGLLLISCNEDHGKQQSSQDQEVSSSDSEPIQHEYTILFSPRESAGEEDYPGQVPSDVSNLYYVEDLQLTHLAPKDKSVGDTITIKLQRDTLLVDLTYYQIDNFSYLLQAGDTMHVKYKKGVPEVQILNRDYPKYEFSYDSLRMALQDNYYPEIFYAIDLSQAKENREAFVSSRERNYESELHLLDSLQRHHLVSQEYYQIAKEKARYKYLIVLSSKSFKRTFKDQEVPYTASDLNKDYLLNTAFYRLFLLQHVDNILIDGQGFQSAGGFQADSPKAFDSIVQNPVIQNNKVRDNLLSHTLGIIYNSFSTKEFEEYYQKFQQEIHDKSVVSAFNRQYLLKHRGNQNDKQALFLNNEDQQISWEGLLADHHGKLIYVDFWASWCAPCIQEIPASKKLSQDYANQDIAFLYISIDKDASKWKRAVESNGLAWDDENLIALNYPEGNLFQELGLRSLPRYILYDHTGKLIHNNAPRPSSEALRTVLDRALNVDHHQTPN